MRSMDLVMVRTIAVLMVLLLNKASAAGYETRSVRTAPGLRFCGGITAKGATAWSRCGRHSLCSTISIVACARALATADSIAGDSTSTQPPRVIATPVHEEPQPAAAARDEAMVLMSPVLASSATTTELTLSAVTRSGFVAVLSFFREDAATGVLQQAEVPDDGADHWAAHWRVNWMLASGPRTGNAAGTWVQLGDGETAAAQGAIAIDIAADVALLNGAPLHLLTLRTGAARNRRRIAARGSTYWRRCTK